MKETILINIFFASIVFGQIQRFEILKQTGASILLLDIVILLITLFFISFLTIKKQFLTYFKGIINSKISLCISIFLFWALLALLLHAKIYSGIEFIGAVGYWFRLAAIFFIGSVLVFLKHLTLPSKIENRFIFWGAVSVAVGFLQLIFVPDFGFMSNMGWDPHQGRLLSTFFDPNYFGIFIVLLMALLIEKIACSKNEKHRIFLTVLFFIFWITLFFTYSRSAWIAGMVAIPIVLWPRSYKLAILSFIIFLAVISTPNRLSNRFMESGSFLSRETFSFDIRKRFDPSRMKDQDPSAAARNISLRRALELGKKNWLTGVGYNGYGPALLYYKVTDEKITGMYSQGSDSSLLNIFATTGVIGLSMFLSVLYFLFSELHVFWKKAQPGGYLFGFLLALMIGSIFNNSLFYLLILAPLVVLISSRIKLATGKK